LQRNNSRFVQHDNALPHALLLIHDFLAKANTTVLPQLSYSPDLALADLFIFSELKFTLEGQRFQMIQEITDPKKGIPGLFPEVATVLGVMHQCRR
jgi:hypothetical protein